jgi:hypothetical protein
MDGSKSLQNRYSHVWKENLMERNVEVAEIQWIEKAEGGGLRAQNQG